LSLERLCDLYFELSNEDRLRILLSLSDKSANLTSLSNTLDLTTQECSRHLQRLVEVEILSKDTEGVYHVSPYGQLVLELQNSLSFVSSHRDYFNTHSVRDLPHEFVLRISELAQSRYTADVMNSFALIESLFKKAEEYVWLVHDQYILSTLPLFLEALRRGLKMKLVELRARAPERKLDHMRPIYLSNEDEETILKARLSGQVESRFLDTIDIFLYVTEKASMIAFPLSSGGFDYLGFASEGSTTHKYCQDLFQVYLERSRKTTNDEILSNYETRMKLRSAGTTRQPSDRRSSARDRS